jgi:cobalt-zinc-cadmium efflux system outer membrane protein
MGGSPGKRIGRARARCVVGTASLCVWVLGGSGAAAESLESLPSPLDPQTVVRLARQRRPEIAAARARASAAAYRPNIDSALPDPMVAVEVAHLPFPVTGINGNLTVQQEFPLSGILSDRRRAAEAEAVQFSADARRVAQDAELEALDAFYMLAERRGTAPILDEQITIVAQLAVISRAHLASGQGMQADVLRLDNERARLQAQRDALGARIVGAEAMLDASLSRPTDAPVPPLSWDDETSEPPPTAELVQRAYARRPELAAARAERSRALAEVDVMRSMYTPMAVVKAGPDYMSYQMPAGWAGLGLMAMVGVSMPIWRDKLSSGVTEAQSMAVMADADIEAMQRMIAGSVATARQDVVAERQLLLSVRHDVLPRARLVVESAISSFGAGQGPMVATLDAVRDLYEVRMQELMDRTRLATAWAKLRRETGDLDATP